MNSAPYIPEQPFVMRENHLNHRIFLLGTKCIQFHDLHFLTTVRHVSDDAYSFGSFPLPFLVVELSSSPFSVVELSLSVSGIGCVFFAANTFSVNVLNLHCMHTASSNKYPHTLHFLEISPSSIATETL